jgi:hypothetical protein
MTRTVETKFYTFDQHNSGGKFINNDTLGHYVIIEAVDMQDAIRRAEQVGIYFNGVAEGIDCGCCGDRWTTPWEDDVAPTPMIYDTEVGDVYYVEFMYRVKQNVIIYYYDGTKKVVPMLKKIEEETKQ